MTPVSLRKSLPAIDWPVVLAAVVLATAVVLYSVGWVESDRCLDAGGRVAKYGLDHACEVSAGRTVPFALTTRDRVMFVTAWIGLFAALWWVMDRTVGVRRRG